jgi:hypothetical protein
MLFYLAPLLLPQFVHPNQRQAPLRYLHTVRGTVNSILVRAPCYLRITPRYNHYYGESRAHSLFSLVLNAPILVRGFHCPIGYWGRGQWKPLTNTLFTSPTSAALNCPRPIIMSGACGSSQIPGALGQHPSGSLVSANIFFAEITTYRDRCQRARHQLLLQLQWWPLLEIPTAPQGGPPSTSSSSSVVATAGLWPAPPRGPAIDVFFNFDGGRC